MVGGGKQRWGLGNAIDKGLSGQNLNLKLPIAWLARKRKCGKKEAVNMMIKWILLRVNYSIPE